MVTWMDTLPYKGALECNMYESNVSIGSAHHGNGILDQSQLTMQQKGHVSQPRIPTENWEFSPTEQGPHQNFITWKSNEITKCELRQWHFTHCDKLHLGSNTIEHDPCQSHTPPSFSLGLHRKPIQASYANWQLEGDREQPFGRLGSQRLTKEERHGLVVLVDDNSLPPTDKSRYAN